MKSSSSNSNNQIKSGEIKPQYFRDKSNEQKVENIVEEQKVEKSMHDLNKSAGRIKKVMRRKNNNSNSSQKKSEPFY